MSLYNENPRHAFDLFLKEGALWFIFFILSKSEIEKV